MSTHDLYPYFEETTAPTFPGEMPVPEPVGSADPGISQLKANADHSHPADTSSGAIVQEKLMRIYGGWGSGAVTATYVPVGNQPGLSIDKKYIGTVLRAHFGCSCWAVVGGPINMAISFNGTNSALSLIGGFYFNDTGKHLSWSGIVDVPNLSSGTFPISFWIGGAMTLNTDVNDLFYGRVMEVWP